MILVLAVQNFRNYDLQNSLLFEILGQIHLQAIRLSDTRNDKKGPIQRKGFLICYVWMVN